MRPSADTLLVWSGAACVYGCAFCPIKPTETESGVSLADLQVALKSVPSLEHRLALVVGGEPLLRPDLSRLLAAIRTAGCAPGIVSTGRGLLYAQIRQRLLRLDLSYLRLQLFGVADTHDRAVAVPGAFEQALSGLSSWLAEAGSNCDVDIALSTRGRPPDGLPGEVEALANLLPSSHAQIVLAVDPQQHEAGFDSEAWRKAAMALQDWNSDPGHPLLVWEGLPASVASVTNIAPLRPAFVAARPQASCLGASGEMVRARVSSREQVQANSFNFVRTETVVACSDCADTCTAHAAAGSTTEPQRQLWLVEGKELVLHSTDSGDFSTAAIAHIKNACSHLFVDRSAPGVLDDFVEGMRRVLPDPVCAGCPNRDACGRRYRIVEGPPFAREEAWIKAFLTTLRGNVLDVGCGEQLYRAEIGQRLHSGDIRYTGLDPDAISLSHARAALPKGRFHLTGIEAFRAPAASFDHILCLRALNHVTDLDEALARMAALLKPGGTLLLVETTPFAMLRQAQQIAAADQAPRAGHQHLRNVTSEEVLPFAQRRGLQVREHHPASLENTNEWILLLQR